MKTVTCFIFTSVIILSSFHSFAQNKNDTVSLADQDSSRLTVKRKPAHPPVKIRDTAKEDLSRIRVFPATSNRTDSNTPALNANIQKPVADTSKTFADTVVTKAPTIIKPENFIINQLLASNKFINIKSTPVYFIEQPHRPSGKEFLFYTLCTVLLILGLFKTFFPAYFKNLFRVYFNTSLRQTQLADQLEQAKFPSFIMNIFFSITGGIYIWLLFSYFHPPRFISKQLLLPFCILGVAALYFIKFCLLKFMGWISDIQDTTNNYIFAIFLVNKITGVVLVPIVILLAFLDRAWLPDVTNISFMVLGLFLLSRYVKSYGAIERKIPLNAFHFIIYIAGAEIIPLFIIYKVAIDYLI